MGKKAEKEKEVEVAKKSIATKKEKMTEVAQKLTSISFGDSSSMGAP